MTLTDALSGTPIGPIHTLTGEKLWLHVPADLVIMPEMIFKVENQGLPLAEDTSRRGNLFVKVHVAFPMSLKISEDQKKSLRQILEPEGVDASKMNPRHNTYEEDAKEVRAGTVPAPEQEFGQDADKENPEPLLCKQM